MEEKKQIDYRIRFLYAIGIYLVLAGHCSGNGGLSLFYDWFPPYAFHMGLFVFCSGYLYKDTYLSNLKNYIYKKFKRLIIPTYLWNIFYAVLVFLLAYAGFKIGGKVTLEKLTLSPITSGHQFAYNLAGWFVIPLFMIEVLVATARKIILSFKNFINETNFFIICFILGCIGVMLARNGFRHDWWLVLVRMLHLLPYFAFGILYKKKLEKLDTLSNTKYFTIVFIIEFIIILLHKGPYSYNSAWCDGFGAVPIEPYLAGFVGIAFWGRIAKLIEPLTKNSYLINTIATNTYTIMINHFLGFMLVKTGYAFIYKFTTLASGFNMIMYKNDLFYYYVPKNIYQLNILYMIAGLSVPILMQKTIDKIKTFIKQCYQ